MHHKIKIREFVIKEEFVLHWCFFVVTYKRHLKLKLTLTNIYKKIYLT